jgi:Sugar phosphate permease
VPRGGGCRRPGDPRCPVREGGGSADPLRDRRLWRIAIGSALVVAPQICLVGFMVLFLHDHRGVSPARAAVALAVVQLLGIGGRIASGRWSDIVGSRLGPLRAIALVVSALVSCVRCWSMRRSRCSCRP